VSAPVSWLEGAKFALEWARENHLGPLQTVTMAVGVVGLVAASRFVKSAKNVVGDVHHVYEQALADQKRAADELREELERANASRRLLASELEAERKEKEDAFRKLSKLRTAALKNRNNDG
jgi:hypothetical protein